MIMLTASLLFQPRQFRATAPFDSGASGASGGASGGGSTPATKSAKPAKTKLAKTKLAKNKLPKTKAPKHKAAKHSGAINAKGRETAGRMVYIGYTPPPAQQATQQVTQQVTGSPALRRAVQAGQGGLIWTILGLGLAACAGKNNYGDSSGMGAAGRMVFVADGPASGFYIFARDGAGNLDTVLYDSYTPPSGDAPASYGDVMAVLLDYTTVLTDEDFVDTGIVLTEIT